MNAVSTAVFGALAARSPVFTTRDVAAAAGVSVVWASRGLMALAEQGLLAQVRRGLWALPRHPDFSAYAVVPHLLRASGEGAADLRGYLSLLSAMNLHGMIDQVPQIIQIVAERTRPSVRTPFGVYEFHQMHPALIGGYEPYRQTGNFDIATPAKALFDVLYLSARRGKRLRHFPELTLPPSFSRAELRSWLAKIDDVSLRAAVEERWDVVRQRLRAV